MLDCTLVVVCFGRCRCWPAVKRTREHGSFSQPHLTTDGTSLLFLRHLATNDQRLQVPYAPPPLSWHFRDLANLPLWTGLYAHDAWNCAFALADQRASFNSPANLEQADGRYVY